MYLTTCLLQTLEPYECYPPQFLRIICKWEYITVKPALSGQSKKDQQLVFKTDYRLMHVKSIAECSKIAFCNTFDLH